MRYGAFNRKRYGTQLWLDEMEGSFNERVAQLSYDTMFMAREPRY